MSLWPLPLSPLLSLLLLLLLDPGLALQDNGWEEAKSFDSLEVEAESKEQKCFLSFKRENFSAYHFTPISPSNTNKSAR